jgi:FKBP-type peptidyl-prolyl cis-trans isomerase
MCAAALLSVSLACSKSDTSPSDGEGASDITSLQITDVQVGAGAEATPGKTVTVHYTGWLYNRATADHHGRQFDTSRDDGLPLTFQLGVSSVIQGWHQGIAGMKVGGRRTLIIPPSLGYGSEGYPGVIPGNATLVFDVELVNVQ